MQPTPNRDGLINPLPETHHFSPMKSSPSKSWENTISPYLFFCGDDSRFVGRHGTPPQEGRHLHLRLLSLSKVEGRQRKSYEGCGIFGMLRHPELPEFFRLSDPNLGVFVLSDLFRGESLSDLHFGVIERSLGRSWFL